MSTDSEANIPLSTSTHASNVDVVVEQILSHCVKYRHKEDLAKYRLVCHKWNDIIVGKMNATERSLTIPLRYGPHVPKFIEISDGQREAREVLNTAMSTLTGTAARLHFDSLTIDRNFYLAGVMPEFTKFLEIQGQSILHLRIKIHPKLYGLKMMETMLLDYAEVVSVDSLHALFLATPNLQSLNFCVRFSSYEYEDTSSRTPEGMRVVEQHCIYPFTVPPYFKKLTNIKIEEPAGFQYSSELLKKLMTLAAWGSNLKSLKIKPTMEFSNFARAIDAVKPWLQDSLTQLSITNARIDTIYSGLEKRIMEFANLPSLTSLTLNKICGYEKYDWIRSLLLAYSNLNTLVLGKEKINSDEMEGWRFDNLVVYDEAQSLFPPVMARLEHLEINLMEFKVRDHVRVGSYGTQFPRLSTLRITGCPEETWRLHQLNHLLPGVGGESQTLRDFNLVGNFDSENDKINILFHVNVTFPTANFDFGLH